MDDRTAALSDQELIARYEKETAELHSQNSELQLQVATLSAKLEEVQRQLSWFQKQLFGSKSERRIIEPRNHSQLLLGERVFAEPDPVQSSETVKSYARRKSEKKELREGELETLLRFDPAVPVEEVTLPVPEIEGLSENEYEIIDHEESYKLAQTPSAYVVIKYIRPVVKVKERGTIHTAPLPPMVIERSFSDVSFHAGSLVDKFVYHLPFNRQHQRLAAFGVKVSRATLPTQAIRCIELLVPVYEAQADSVYSSRVLTMDDTWMKVGVASPKKMHKGYFWPMYGDKDEVIFPYTESRNDDEVEKLLGDRFQGVLLADGHAAYDKYVQRKAAVTRAQCWVHTRRNFYELTGPPELREGALDRIERMYDLEAQRKKRKLEDRATLAFRREQVKPVVEEFFEWLKASVCKHLLLPSDPFLKAATYALKREQELKVFLSDAEVPMDTNHNERALRVIPMGRRNYLFCWTELGARSVGIIQSLLVTCKLHAVDPYIYLVDVLQRIQSHPIRQVKLLTPRLWKEHFANAPLVSPLEIAQRQKHELLLQKIASQKAA